MTAGEQAPSLGGEGSASLVPLLILAPLETEAATSKAEGDLAARASILSRVDAEGPCAGGLTWLEVDWIGRPRKDPVMHLVAGAGEHLDPTPPPAVAAWRHAGGKERPSMAGGALHEQLLGALADHSPYRWGAVPRGDHGRLLRPFTQAKLLRLDLAGGHPDQPIEIYPLRASTIERALRRVRDDTLVRIRLLALPRRLGAPLRRVTSSHLYGRLVPAGVQRSAGGADAKRADAADVWQFLVQVEIHCTREVPADLLAAIASDIRGTGKGSIGVVLDGKAAAVSAEWRATDSRESAERAGWPRSTVQLNLREAACLLALRDGQEADAVTADRLTRVPARLGRVGVRLGTVAGSRRPVAVEWPELYRHALMIGGTGSGKSTALLNLVVQAVRDPAQPVVIVIDPHGSLAEAIAGRLTPAEQGRTQWWDPTDPIAPMAWNPLEERSQAAKDMVISFAWEQWAGVPRTYLAGMGPIAEQVLNALLTTVMSIPGGTLADAHRLIQDETRLDRYKASLTDETALAFWKMQKSLPSNTKGEHAPYLTSKLAPFSMDDVLRNALSRRSTLDIGGLIDQGGILLVSLRKATAGSEAATIIARLLKRRIWRAITARGAGGPEQRPVVLAIDEFIDYQQPELDSIMLQAGRKFHTSVVLATQNLASIDPTLREAVAANTSTLLAYRVGIYDAMAVSSMLGDQSLAATLTTLPNFRAIARVPVNGEPLPPVLMDASKPPAGFSQARVDEVRAIVRVRYGVPSDEDGNQPAPGSANAITAAVLSVPLAGDALLSVLRAGELQAELLDDDTVQVTSLTEVPLYVIAEEDELRILALFQFKPRASRAARVALANEVNDRLRIVRAAAPNEGSPARLEVDWYLKVTPGAPAAVVIEALLDFAALVARIVEIDAQGRGILDRDKEAST